MDDQDRIVRELPMPCGPWLCAIVTSRPSPQPFVLVSNNTQSIVSIQLSDASLPGRQRTTSSRSKHSPFVNALVCPRQSDILLTDFACANPCVTHCWMFRVVDLTKQFFILSLQSFFQMIYDETITAFEFAGKVKGIFRWQGE